MLFNLILINIVIVDFNNILIDGIKFMVYSNEGMYVKLKLNKVLESIDILVNLI